MGRMSSTLLLLVTFFATCYCQLMPVINMSTVVEIREDLPVGAFAFKIEAYDPDGDSLRYGIKDISPADNNAYFFNVDENTGSVTIKSKLDRETLDLFGIQVVVRDNDYEETKDIYISVKDANDNRPLFQGLPYGVSIPENTTVNTIIFRVNATDADAGLAKVVTYQIVEVMPSAGTSLFSINGGDGNIKLEGQLSYTSLSSNYQLKIRATDGGGPLNDVENFIQSSETTVFITVTDVPDLDPQFLGTPYLATVDEHSPVGKSILKVQARDPDTGVNDAIRYSLINVAEYDLFQINEVDGVITVKKNFDREDFSDPDKIVELQVKATEANPNVNGIHASATEKVQITIGDINDNEPKFYNCADSSCLEESNFNGNIDEHTSAGLPVAGLHIKVKDTDKGVNSQFTLLLEGTDKDAFSVSPLSALSESFVQILVKDSNAVDYEKKKTMTVQVIATDAQDPGKQSTATVTIQINDINDNSPVFKNDTYSLAVEEHCADGTVLGVITATDKDTMDANSITYRLVPDSILPYFGVDPKHGTISVNNGNLLNWEGTNSYSPTLQAIDTAGNIGSTILEITVLDINDHAPEINRNPYEVLVGEGSDLKLQIQAIDGDKPGSANSKLQYRIDSSEYSNMFTIDINTGLLENRVPLDRESINPSLNGLIKLNVTVSDMGTPPLSSQTQVFITVEDVNDNGPVFDRSTYTFYVKERETGIPVGSVFARDADQLDFYNRISYRIIEGSFGSFLISSEKYEDGYKGNIIVDPEVELDYESNRKTYTLKVEATDLGQKKDDAIVEVVVVDVNDETPVFPNGISITVKENTTFSGPVELIEGTDPDTNHSLVYELTGTECRCNGSIGPCQEDWLILEPTGAIKTNPDNVIDHEMCDQVLMTARVVDIYTEKGQSSSEGVVTINIEDINDNAPEFTAVMDFFVVVSENVEQGTSVASVRAKDRDSAMNAKIKFDVLSVQFAGSDGSPEQNVGTIFQAESSDQADAQGFYSGIITSRQTLNSDKRGKYLVNVAATDSGGLRTTDVLQVLTVDKSFRVSLQFESSVEDVTSNLDEIRGNQPVTYLETYFVFPNGTALDSDAVWRILNQKEVYETYGSVLRQYGLTTIMTGNSETVQDRTDLFILIGVVGALVIVLAVTTTSLICVRRSYKTKLKAAKAMNSASMVAIEGQKAGPVVPGTNKYTMEGANPVLNLNIDTSTDLGFDEESSNPDKLSLNSLDYNIDMTMSEKDTMPMMAIEEEDEENGSMPHYIEPLGEALAQRGKKKGSESPVLSFSNPSVSTTDL
ncbi:cadherin-related family member 2 [Chanos chanos]|uniref:Cadherin-related family member 2 n=1 Tax=Chanos chanos TaxID=29144 RepID=A0A6J2UQ42_CHACN|nr:cadherin-related family member 2 [Chanos chanos]